METEIDNQVRIVNRLANKYKAHQTEVYKREQAKDFSDVNGVDFNEWAYDTLHEIEDEYFEELSKLHGMLFKKNGFVAIK